jgi:hypothetical protein
MLGQSRDAAPTFETAPFLRQQISTEKPQLDRYSPPVKSVRRTAGDTSCANACGRLTPFETATPGFAPEKSRLDA